MARAKNFRHPADARNNEKIAALVGDHGPAGYGAYWMILEILHREEGMCIEYTEKRMKRLGGQIGMEREAFARLLQDMIEIYELLEVADGRLVSAISYTGSRKSPKAIAIEPAANDATIESAHIQKQDVEEPAVPSPEGHTAEELEQHNALKELIATRAPNAERLLPPISVAESLFFYENYEQVAIIAALDRLQGLFNISSYKSVYDVLKSLLDKP
ncbi:MAG: DUF4373 domain-containing protein [Sphingobacteriales bacterium]|nr:MAG: DUF4373 domain-containing protein [Sphingobacteriales bacterium]